jgi:DnaJ-class molecular chaperone
MTDHGYYNDHRVVAGMRAKEEAKIWSFDQRAMILTATLLIEDEETEENAETPFSFPAKFEVCPTCEGKGSHVDPSIDAHGITQEEFSEWSQEEKGDYFSGTYDVPCFECEGERLVAVVDESRLSAEQRVNWEKVEKYLQEAAWGRAVERRAMVMGY